MGIDFYRSLYEDNSNVDRFVVRGAFPEISSEETQHLVKDIKDEEVALTIFTMGGWKAPGPDGLPPIFFQANWGIIKKVVFNWVREVFSNISFPYPKS